MRIVFWLCCAVLLNACSTPAVQYYQLPDSVFRQPENRNTIALDVVMADFLNSNALIYQNSPETVHFAQQHLWAEQPERAVANVLANHLNDLSSQRNYIPQNGGGHCPCIQVVLQRFQGAYDGKVRVAGYTRFLDTNGKLIRIRSFALEKEQMGDGYAAMVNTLGDALKDAARQIIQ